MILLLYKKKVVTSAVATTNTTFGQNIMVIHTGDEKSCINSLWAPVRAILFLMSSMDTENNCF